MGKRKNGIRLLCTVMLVCMMSIGMTICSRAAIYKPYEAQLWMEAQQGKKYGEGDSLSFIQAYMAAIGVKAPAVSTANAYITCALPSGWKRVKAADGEPQTGDILIFQGNGMYAGAMGIYYKQTTMPYSKAIYMQGPWEPSSVVKFNSIDYDDSMFRGYRYGFDYWGYIRPNYANISVKSIRISNISARSYTVTMNLKNPLVIDNMSLMLRTETTDSKGKSVFGSGIGNLYTITKKNRDGWSISMTKKLVSTEAPLKAGQKYKITITPEYGGIAYPSVKTTFTLPKTSTKTTKTTKAAKITKNTKATKTTKAKNTSTSASKTVNAYVGNLRYKATRSSKGNTAVVTGVKKTTLTAVTIPAAVKIKGVSYKVTGISSRAFYFNKYLKAVSIGKNVTYIGNEAFSHCYRLQSIKIYSKVVKSIGTNVFKFTVKGNVIQVPKSSSKAYRRLLSKCGIVKATLRG